MKEMLNIDELSGYLGIKKSSLYSKVERKEIPFYKIGHLVRFRRSDIDLWMEKLRSESIPTEIKAKREMLNRDGRDEEVDQIVKRAIAHSREMKYTPKHKGDRTRIRGLGKEVSDGTL